MVKIENGVKYIDYLNEDEPIPRQNFVCLSFLSPEGIRNCSTRGIKIRGVYETYDEAKARADELSKIDPDFDVFVGEVGKWCPWDPDPNSTQDQVYQEKELNDLMKGYKDNLQKVKKMEQQRKNDMIANAAEQEQSNLSKTQQRLRKKVEAKEKERRLKSIAQKQLNNEQLPTSPLDDKIKVKENELTTKDKLAKQEKDRLDTHQSTINETSSNLESIDNQLAQIQALYDKLNKKKSTNASKKNQA